MVSENTTISHQVPYSFRYPPVGLVLTNSSSTMKWFDSITSMSSIFILVSLIVQSYDIQPDILCHLLSQALLLYLSCPLPVVHI